MSDLLAIVDQTNTDALVDEIVRCHPDRVTVLLEGGPNSDWGSDESPRGRALRDRLANVLASIEQRTGAVVVGLVGSREQLRGWRFDRVVGGRRGAAALT
jgi:hypothetical protein